MIHLSGKRRRIKTMCLRKCILSLCAFLCGLVSMAVNAATTSPAVTTSQDSGQGKHREDPLPDVAKIVLYIALVGVFLVFLGLIVVCKMQNNLTGIMRNLPKRKSSRKSAVTSIYPTIPRGSNLSFMITNDLYVQSDNVQPDIANAAAAARQTVSIHTDKSWQVAPDDGDYAEINSLTEPDATTVQKRPTNKSCYLFTSLKRQ